MNKELLKYIESKIIPRYRKIDKAHDESHELLNKQEKDIIGDAILTHRSSKVKSQDHIGAI